MDSSFGVRVGKNAAGLSCGYDMSGKRITQLEPQLPADDTILPLNGRPPFEKDDCPSGSILELFLQRCPEGTLSLGSIESCNHRTDNLSIEERALKEPHRIRWGTSQVISLRPSMGEIPLKYKRKIQYKDKEKCVDELYFLITEVMTTVGNDGTCVPRRGDRIHSVNGTALDMDNHRRLLQSTEICRKEITYVISRPHELLVRCNSECSVITSPHLPMKKVVKSPLPSPPTERVPNLVPIRPLVGPTPQPLPRPPSINSSGSSQSDDKSLETVYRTVLRKRMERHPSLTLIFHMHTEAMELKKQILRDETVTTSVGVEHTHILSNDSKHCFIKPTNENCFCSSESNKNTYCCFETHRKSLEMAYEIRKSLNNDEIGALANGTAGGVSLESMSDSLNTQNVFKIHIQVLTLEGIKKHWFAPVLYSKHSVNVIIIDFQMPLTEVISLLSVDLREIQYHSSSQAKAIIVARGLDARDAFNCKQEISKHLAQYLDLLIYQDATYPFFLAQPDCLRSEILQALTGLVHTPRGAEYPYLASEMAHQLRSKETLRSRQYIKKELRKLANCECSELEQHGLVESTLAYLHATGHAYVPECSALSKCRTEPSHDIMLSAHCLYDTMDYYVLQNPNRGSCVSHLESHRLETTGCASLEFFKALFQSPYVDGFITILRELNLLLDRGNNIENGTPSDMIVPWHPANRALIDIPQCWPSLLICFHKGLPKQLMVSLLDGLRGQASTSIVNFENEQARLHIFGHTVWLSRLSWTGRDACALADRNVQIFIREDSGNRPHEFAQCLLKYLKEFTTVFRETIRFRFGPPCPEPSCNQGPYHILDLLTQPDDAALSCAGIALSCHPAVKPYYSAGVTAANKAPNQTLSAGISTRLDYIPGRLNAAICQLLNEENIFQHNWVGLARLLDFTEAQIQILKLNLNPTNEVLRFAGSHLGKTLSDLMLLLGHMNLQRRDVLQECQCWLENNYYTHI